MRLILFRRTDDPPGQAVPPDSLPGIYFAIAQDTAALRIQKGGCIEYWNIRNLLCQLAVDDSKGQVSGNHNVCSEMSWYSFEKYDLSGEL